MMLSRALIQNVRTNAELSWTSDPNLITVSSPNRSLVVDPSSGPLVSPSPSAQTPNERRAPVSYSETLKRGAAEQTRHSHQHCPECALGTASA